LHRLGIDAEGSGDVDVAESGADERTTSGSPMERVSDMR
jgi:hypothetical protein